MNKFDKNDIILILLISILLFIIITEKENFYSQPNFKIGLNDKKSPFNNSDKMNSWTYPLLINENNEYIPYIINDNKVWLNSNIVDDSKINNTTYKNVKAYFFNSETNNWSVGTLILNVPERIVPNKTYYGSFINMLVTN
jgi:hypothetical protein